MSNPSAPSQGDEELPMPVWGIWILCFFFPVIAGAVLYYSWRGTNLKAANYANRVSFICAGFWVVISLVRHFVLAG